jgi:uncharacterized tellurite resistance protein B-like protein
MGEAPARKAWNWIQGVLSNDKLESGVKPNRLHLATCAVLLEVAWADEHFAEEERARILDALCRRFSLSPNDAESLVEVSQAKREASPDLWHFTHEINEICTQEEKIEILQEVWRVIYADGVLEGEEDDLVHRIARLLNLNHPQLIQAKLAVKQERGQPPVPLL